MHENSFEYIQKQFLFWPNPPSNQFLVLYNSFNGFHNICVENIFMGFPPVENYYTVKKRFEEPEFEKFMKLFSQVSLVFCIFLRTENYVSAFNG